MSTFTGSIITFISPSAITYIQECCYTFKTADLAMNYAYSTHCASAINWKRLEMLFILMRTFVQQLRVFPDGTWHVKKKFSNIPRFTDESWFICSVFRVVRFTTCKQCNQTNVTMLSFGGIYFDYTINDLPSSSVFFSGNARHCRRLLYWH